MFTLFFVNGFCFGYEGLMAGQKHVKIITTQYFDIIFPEKSRKSAEVLAQNADSIYVEIAETYNLKNDLHVPLVITSATDTFNAYSSIVPYNHIVLFDTLPDEKMAVQPETLLATFRHELTHTITMNATNDFWYGVKKVLGSSYYVGAATSTQAALEGATVSEESRAGYGRLNDEYSRHIVKQAKIEGKTPRYASVQGARDIYPYGNVSYMFGGEFAKYLRQTYGEEKYAQYWYYLTNWKGFTFDIVFKEVYGIKQKDAWQAFFSQYKVPNDFLDNDEIALKNIKKKGSNYVSLVASKKRIAYVDKFSGTIFVAPIAQTENGTENLGKPKRLFAWSGINNIFLSHDARFLTVNYDSTQSLNVTHKSIIYDFETHKTFFVPEKHIKNAIVIQNESDYYLAATQSDCQNEKIIFYALEFSKNGKLKRLAKMASYEINGEFNQQFLSPASDDKGNLYYVLKTGMDFAICSVNVVSGKILKFSLPSNDMRIRNLSYANGALCFSFTQKDTLPRVGFYDFSEFTLLSKDKSGGFFCPVKIGTDNIAFIAQFFEESMIQTCSYKKMPFITMTSPQQRNGAPQNASRAQNASFFEAAAPSEKRITERAYNPFKYIIKGTIIPLSISMLYQMQDDLSLEQNLCPWGVTFISTTPWSSPVFYVSAGYSAFSKAGSVSLNVSGGSDTDVLKYGVLAQVGFDKTGFKQAVATANLSSAIPIGKAWYFLAKETATAFYGTQYLTQKSDNSFIDFFTANVKSKDSETRLFAESGTILAFSNIKQYGASPLQKGGVQFALSYTIALYEMANDGASLMNKKFDYPLQNLSLNVTAKFPYLIPVHSKKGFIYNFPLTLSLDFAPSLRYYVGAQAELLLFSYEIQQSPNWFTILYFNRIYITVGCNFKYGTEKYHAKGFFLDTKSYIYDITNFYAYLYEDYTVAAILSLTPNFGAAATKSCQFDITARFHYRPRPEANQNMFSLDIIGIAVF